MWGQALLESDQARAQGGSEETVVTHIHEAARQDVLEEALDKMLHGEAAGLELAGIGGTIFESDLGSLQAAILIDGDQASVAEGDAMDVGSQVFEGSLSIPYPFAMHDPFSPPDYCGDLCVERRSA